MINNNLIVFYHLEMKESNLSLVLTKINVKNKKTGLLFHCKAVTITMQIENNFNNAVYKNKKQHKFAVQTQISENRRECSEP